MKLEKMLVYERMQEEEFEICEWPLDIPSEDTCFYA